MSEKMFRIHFEGRNSGHNGAKAKIYAVKPQVGINIGFTERMLYYVLNPNDPEIRICTFFYEDGMHYGPILLGKVAPGRWRHLSSRGSAYNFDVLIEEVK